MSLLYDTISQIEPLDAAAMAAAGERQSQLTKPAGSLGRLESLSVQLAGIQARAMPDVSRRLVI
ncbi:MAG TPA: nicotinate-nucleotide--dimethylbenzimidazole phosphoribosyltransferase, partial [Chloroflexota bacterium]|nr:nicotinate-nucleotide--dimethylbenzimidazole phosphoribosyltransferase [Chloroflexota bacterium]